MSDSFLKIKISGLNSCIAAQKQGTVRDKKLATCSMWSKAPVIKDERRYINVCIAVQEGLNKGCDL